MARSKYFYCYRGHRATEGLAFGRTDPFICKVCFDEYVRELLAKSPPVLGDDPTPEPEAPQ